MQSAVCAASYLPAGGGGWRQRCPCTHLLIKNPMMMMIDDGNLQYSHTALKVQEIFPASRHFLDLQKWSMIASLPRLL